MDAQRLDLSVIATAEELRAATEHFASKPKKSATEACVDWMDLLRRRAGKLFKDAAAAGRWAVEVEPPFQPDGPEDLAELRKVAKRLHHLFPGCRICVCEEESEIIAEGGAAEKEGARYTIEISWARRTT